MNKCKKCNRKLPNKLYITPNGCLWCDLSFYRTKEEQKDITAIFKELKKRDKMDKETKREQDSDLPDVQVDPEKMEHLEKGAQLGKPKKPKRKPITRDFKGTIRDRIFRDIEFRTAILKETLECMRVGDMKTADTLFTKYIGIMCAPIKEEPDLDITAPKYDKIIEGGRTIPFPLMAIQSEWCTVFCPLCRSSFLRKHVLFGKRYCINPKCKNFLNRSDKK